MTSRRRVAIPIPERNRQILELRHQGLSRTEVARKFKLSPSRIYLIEKQDEADRSMGERRTKLREEIRAADDMDGTWPVEELVDALGLIVVTRKRLMDHFVEKGQSQISLREFMDMCLDVPIEGRNWMSPPLYRVKGVGKIGYWSVVNGLTSMDLGSRCNQEWQWRLVRVKQENQVTGATPFSHLYGKGVAAGLNWSVPDELN
jgi:hypothetical protein